MTNMGSNPWFPYWESPTVTAPIRLDDSTILTQKKMGGSRSCHPCTVRKLP